MTRKWAIWLAAAMLVAGVSVLLYPVVSNMINRRHGSYAIQELQEQVGRLNTEEMDRVFAAARMYNRQLLSQEEDMEDLLKRYEAILDFGGGIMGYIWIPEINVKLPIYHGVDTDVLEKGIGHMPMSAFPIGGSGNHTILTGHTGLPSATLFTDLILLEEEDIFKIVIGENSVCYEEVFVMITLAILLVLIALGAMMLGTVGIGVILAFGDVIIAVLIVYAICKLFGKKRKSKK